MDKLDSKNLPIKLTFLEITPPINDIIKNKEEINIIFQGHDNFYDFKKHLSSKIPIQLNRYKKSLIITLVKSNNIFATGLFTVRPGEQNIIFNYETKKKIVSTRAVNINNLDCIKIKILCEFDNKEKDKDKDNASNVNNNLNDHKNDSGNKYVPKVNLMKSNHLNNNQKNKNNKKVYDKKKKFLGNFYGNNSIKKNSINSSQEFSLAGEYSAYLTEEMNNNLKQSNNTTNFNSNEIKKLNPYCSSKINNNLPRKTEVEMSTKSKGPINKFKSKNYFSTIKKQYRQNFGSQIKMNNSSLNLINQKANLHSIDNENNNNSNNINNNVITNRHILKPTISFNKNNKRNINFNNKISNTNNNNKNVINSIDNFIAGQIIEHVDMSKKDNNNKINNNKINNNTNDNNNNKSEKKNVVNINKNTNTNPNTNDLGNINNNENKKRKFNNNNITMNSISTAGTKKNELEFSINSLFEYKDIDDKNNINKNGFMPFTNRLNNDRLQQKLSGGNSINGNNNKHTFNKSLCQQSFIDKIFNENDLNENEQKMKGNLLCKSCDKLKKDNNEINNINLNNDNNENNENNKETNNVKEDINKIDNNNNNVNDFDVEEDEEMDNYTRIKEDFNLLYNEDYIKQINEDLLKLEIELFFEKMSELFSAYHLLMDDKILENQIIKRDYKKNISNYLLYTKLINKLQFLKTAQHIKNHNLKEKGINLDQQNISNVNVNINELNILKMIFPDNNKSHKLKKIISVILKKHGNKELLDEKFKMLLK